MIQYRAVARNWYLTKVILLGLSVVLLAGLAGSAATRQVATKPARHATSTTITISPAGTGAVGPKTPITVAAAGGTLTAVTAVNDHSGNAVHGTFAADHRSWRSDEPLGYGADYTVHATGSGDAEETGAVHVVQPEGTAFPAMIPAPNAAPDYGVGQIFGVSFDHPVTDRATAERSLKVTSVPEQPGSWYWMDNKTVHFRPKTYWQPGTTVTLTAGVYGVDLGGGRYGETDRTATYKIHDSWVAKADGGTHQVQVFHNGQLLRTMPTSLGSPDNPSHEGPHVVSERLPHVVMDSCTFGVCKGQPGYYKSDVDLAVRISNDGEFVHSAPWSVGQQGNSNVSHGCVNLAPANAQWFFDHFNLGDVVEITNSGGPQLPVWDVYGDWAVSWAQWQKGSAL
ncbi:hypothetical protein D5S17_13325 [Pseudonocardiaceae bacterium YIM PH 21723]|nr:hypothetical protein D5S17_13325 [Pseudonocardiaceae bacterium YIM PH 21723]